MVMVVFPSIALLLCKWKTMLMAEYAVRDLRKLLGAEPYEEGETT